MALALTCIPITVLFILSASAILGQARNLQTTSDLMRTKYKQWMADNKKFYVSNAAEEERFEIFKNNLEFIEKSNSEDKPYKLALNKWADLTNEEFQRTHLGLTPDLNASRINRLQSFKTTTTLGNDLQAVPATLDWRQQGAVTPVKQQGQCGCCWAFATIAAVESVHKIKKGQLINLSEQQLVDCDRKTNKGCDGGHMTTAYDYIYQNGGIAGQSQYPYAGNNGASCNQNQASQAQVKISGFSLVPPNKETEMMRAVASQPIAVGVDSNCDAFRFYSSGILTTSCGTKLFHALTIVGYGEEGGKKYWIVKNSWGASWGEKGYIRFGRETGDPHGICGINMDASYPVIV